jgi:EAL domain-containing protein (putative c-di-GMP-specific phosphodiesterase class I)/CheY-like chemotaxis protein
MDMPAAALPLASLLVVDDSVVQRNHAVALCRSLGVEMIYEAASGAEALDLLALLVLPPDALIIDLEMPGMNGIELIQQLHRRGLQIPLIVASSREASLIQSVEALARNLGLPVLAGLQKPLGAIDLQGALQQLNAALDLVPASAQPMPAGPAISRAELAEAIATGGIGVHYQPKVDMRTGIVRGTEALARWSRAGGSFVRPDSFIALAEREGLIHALTMSVLSQSLAQAARWNAQGLKLSMAVNLSPRLLTEASLLGEILALLLEHDVRPEQLVLEITESSVVDCMGAALGVLAHLRLKGVGLSIDDYGTGFSSMQQLARIPFTELKIDRSFVHGANQRGNLRVILQSAVDLARQLHLVTVAEGVETLEDWRLMQACGCTVAQGYLIAKPMPASELPAWLKHHQHRLPELRSQPAVDPLRDSS